MTTLDPNTEEEQQVVAIARRDYWTGGDFLFGIFSFPGLFAIAGGIFWDWNGALIGTTIGLLVFALSLKYDGPSAHANRALEKYRVAEAKEDAEMLKSDRKRVKWYLRKCKDLDARKLRSAVNVAGYAYDVQPPAEQLVIDPRHLLDEEVILIADFIDEVIDLEEAVSNGRATASLSQLGEEEIDRRISDLVPVLSALAHKARTEADDAIRAALKDLKVAV